MTKAGWLRYAIENIIKGDLNMAIKCINEVIELLERDDT